VVATTGDAPVVLATYIQALLAQRGAKTQNAELDEAAGLIKRLEEKEPKAGRTVELKAKLLFYQGKGDEAARLIKQYARTMFEEKKDPMVLYSAGQVLAWMKLGADAEEMTREYIKQVEAKRPDHIWVLADVFSSLGRLREALDVCEQMLQKPVPPETVVRVAVTALRRNQPGPGDLERVEQIIAKASQKLTSSVDLDLSRADFLDAKGDYAGAIEAYREVLKASPQNIIALNNLGWLLAMAKKNGSEGVPMLDKVIQIDGPQAGWLDTRGTVYMAMGNYDRAIEEFSQAATQSQQASYFYHLAVAHWKANNRGQAQTYGRRAISDMGLKEKDLHPLERDEFRKFAKEMGIDA
jgi:tetratricopeptide (TPR) repeat protein